MYNMVYMKVVIGSGLYPNSSDSYDYLDYIFLLVQVASYVKYIV